MRQHRFGCLVSIRRMDLVRAAEAWHAVAHEGGFADCRSAECYACHPLVLPPSGEPIPR